MRIDHAPFRADLFFYFLKSKYLKNPIYLGLPRAFKCYAIRRFIDDLCTMKDSSKFSNSFNFIYPKELELKIEYQGTRAAFF